MKTEYTREELIEICRDAVVPFKKWNDRDSYSAQRSIQSIYEALSCGVPYDYYMEQDTIQITFESPTHEQQKDMSNYYLDIDSRDSYIDWYREEYGEDSEPEMFDGSGINWNGRFLGSYMPTRERLDSADGDDWY